MGKFLQFKAQAAGKNAELLVYGEIDEWWGEVRSRDFAEQLQAITSDEIDVRINSDGGSVFTAQAIYSSLKRHPAKINVYIDGIAASAATIIAMAGDRIIMPENAMMMVHNPMTGAYGNAEDMREVADILDKVAETLIAVYRSKTGLDDDKIKELLSKDTYLTAAECLDLGLVDEVTSALKISASRKNSGDYVVNGLTIEADRYKRLPEAWRNDVECTKAVEPKKPETKEVTSMTLDDFKAQHPELFQAVVDSAVQQERERIKAIEEMTMQGHEAIALSAKFENAITPEAFAVELIKAEKAVKEKYLADRKADAQAANVDDASNQQQDTHEHQSEGEKVKAAASVMARAFSARNGRQF